jgi:hypothetical protein
MQLFLLILKLFLKIKRSQDLELLAIGSLSVHTCAWNLVPIWSKTHHWVIYLEFCLRLPCFDAHKSWPFKTGWRFPCQRAEQRCVRSGLAKLQACPFFGSWPETHYKRVNISLSKDLLLIVTTTNNVLNCVQWKHKI